MVTVAMRAPGEDLSANHKTLECSMLVSLVVATEALPLGHKISK